MQNPERLLIESLKLNYVLHYQDRNFIPSDSTCDCGEIKLEQYTDDLLIYQPTNADTVETSWDSFAKIFRDFIKNSSEHEQNAIPSINDIKLLIPSLKITCNREQNINTIYETSCGFLVEEVLVGGALIIKNGSDYSEDILYLLEARIIRIIDEVRWNYKNLFTETIIDSSFPIIEDLEGNNLNNTEKLRTYVEEIYGYKNCISNCL